MILYFLPEFLELIGLLSFKLHDRIQLRRIDISEYSIELVDITHQFIIEMLESFSDRFLSCPYPLKLPRNLCMFFDF